MAADGLPVIGGLQGGIFAGDQQQGLPFFILIGDHLGFSECDHAAVVGGVLLGVDLILADDAEGDFAVSGDGVDLVAGGGAVEVDDAVLVAVAEADGIGIAVAPGYGENADRMRTQISEYLEDAAKARIELDEAKRELVRLRRQLEGKEVPGQTALGQK